MKKMVKKTFIFYNIRHSVKMKHILIIKSAKDKIKSIWISIFSSIYLIQFLCFLSSFLFFIQTKTKSIPPLRTNLIYETRNPWFYDIPTTVGKNKHINLVLFKAGAQTCNYFNQLTNICFLFFQNCVKVVCLWARLHPEFQQYGKKHLFVYHVAWFAYTHTLV